MFKAFTITYKGKTIGEKDINSKKIIKLLEYLFFYSKRAIASVELIDFIWNSENVDNSMPVLKNLVYRLRMMLKSELQIEDLIVTGNKTYCVSQEFNIIIDAFTFEKLHLQINLKPDNCELYKKMLKIYTGNFLVEIRDDIQSISKAVYYQSIYITMVLDYGRILEEKGKYVKLENIMKKAIQLGCFDEYLYEMLIRSLYFQKQYIQACKTYKQTVDLLYRTLGVGPSKGMEELYDMMKSKCRNNGLDSIDDQNNLLTDKQLGAYLCQYNAFKELYNIQIKKLEHLEVNGHLCFLTIHDYSHYQNDKEKSVEETVQRIQKALVDGLRIDDIVSRFSKNEFVVLLSLCNYEDSHYVMNRVLRYIQRVLNNRAITMDISIKVMESGDVL